MSCLIGRLKGKTIIYCLSSLVRLFIIDVDYPNEKSLKNRDAGSKPADAIGELYESKDAEHNDEQLETTSEENVGYPEDKESLMQKYGTSDESKALDKDSAPTSMEKDAPPRCYRPWGCNGPTIP